MSECYSSYTLQLLLDLFLLKVCSLLLYTSLMPFHPLLEDALKTARSRHFLEDIIDPCDKLLSCCKLLSSYLLLQVSEHCKICRSKVWTVGCMLYQLETQVFQGICGGALSWWKRRFSIMSTRFLRRALMTSLFKTCHIV